MRDVRQSAGLIYFHASEFWAESTFGFGAWGPKAVVHQLQPLSSTFPQPMTKLNFGQRDIEKSRMWPTARKPPAAGVTRVPVLHT